MTVLPLPLTEQQNPASRHLDTLSIGEIVAVMQQEDYAVLAAVAEAKPQIEAVITQVVQSLQNGGRLFYIGAGTSGRLGVLDATECPPTYRTSPDMVQAIIAGGRKALEQAVEGAEDNTEVAEELSTYHFTAKDTLIGIAASGTTPYVRAALRFAREKGTATALLSCNPIPQDDPAIQYYMILAVGPEIVSGSTRMKAGTATKLVLNMISTISMIQLGKVYDNLMVDLNISNSKLHKRACRMVSQLTGLSEEAASAILEQAQGEVKTAILMAQKHYTYPEAVQCLAEAQGFLRRALESHAVV